LFTLLAGVAGYVDAVSYLDLGGVFTANMTGNFVLLSIAIGQGETSAAFRSGVALCGFVLGGVIGEGFARRIDEASTWSVARRVVLLELGTLSASAVGRYLATPFSGWVTGVVILLSAIAMGLQTVATRHLWMPDVSTTYLTGYLTNMVVRTVDWLGSTPLRGGASPDSRGSASSFVPWLNLFAVVWILYAIGAIAGSALVPRWPSLVLAVPVAVLVIVLGATTR